MVRILSLLKRHDFLFLNLNISFFFFWGGGGGQGVRCPRETVLSKSHGKDCLFARMQNKVPKSLNKLPLVLFVSKLALSHNLAVEKAELRPNSI